MKVSAYMYTIDQHAKYFNHDSPLQQVHRRNNALLEHIILIQSHSLRSYFLILHAYSGEVRNTMFKAVCKTLAYDLFIMDGWFEWLK